MSTTIGTPARSHRARFLGVGVSALFIAITKALPRVHQWEQERVTAAIATTGASHSLERAVATRSSRAKILAEWRASQTNVDSMVFIAADPGSIGARMVGAVRDLASDHDVVLHSVQPRVDSTATRNLLRVSAHLSMTADVQGLMDLVEDLESADPLLRVIDLSIVQSDVSAADDRPDALKIELTVQGIGVLRRPKGE
jgi:hypothetical protein